MNLSRRRFFIYTSFPLRCTAASIFTGAAVCRSIFIVPQEAKGKKEYRRGGRDARELFYILSSDIEFACKCMIMRGNRGEGRFSRVGEGSGEMRGYRRENERGEKRGENEERKGGVERKRDNVCYWDTSFLAFSLSLPFTSRSVLHALLPPFES